MYGEASSYYPEEESGWHGYIEWEKYPERKKEVAEILSKYKFDGVRFYLSVTEQVQKY